MWCSFAANFLVVIIPEAARAREIISTEKLWVRSREGLIGAHPQYVGALSRMEITELCPSLASG